MANWPIVKIQYAQAVLGMNAMFPFTFIAVSILAQSFLSVSPFAFQMDFSRLISLKGNEEMESNPLRFCSSAPVFNRVFADNFLQIPISGKFNPLIQKNPYPVQTLKQARSKKSTHMGLATLYGRQIVATIGIPGSDSMDEKTIVSLLKSSYLDSIDKVHQVLEQSPGTSHRLNQIKQQLSGMISRFAGRPPSAEQVLQLTDYWTKIAFLNQLPGLDKEGFKKVLLGITYKIVVKEKSPGVERINVMKLKTWLAVTMPILVQTDFDLNSLKKRIGDYHTSLQWRSELHLNSFAKHSARRIYRNWLNSTVIAETLDENGEAIETEMIEQSSSGVLNFASFDARGVFSPFGMIRNHRGESAIRLAPDVCYGCHYNLKTGKFNVLRPSFSDLNLRDSDFANETLIKNRELFATPGERIILHKYI
ncbi:MAG: hypothetical protein AB8G05_05230 [Oligoflexales bacterium]